jgi:putative transposase
MLTDALARNCLHHAIEEVRHDWPFAINAIVLLPDHFHTVWSLPRGDSDYSLRIRRIKELFTRRYLEGGGMELPQSTSRAAQAYRGIWQKRFWEHTVRDDEDLKRCVDYVHWNPKKHGLVTSVNEWQWSSFHRYVEAGEYEQHWGGTDPTPGFDTPEWTR